MPVGDLEKPALDQAYVMLIEIDTQLNLNFNLKLTQDDINNSSQVEGHVPRSVEHQEIGKDG